MSDQQTVSVCALADLAPGEVRRVASVVPPVTIFHTTAGELFALDDTCTHQDASLADGWVEDGVVECPLHGSCFDLRTGAVDQLPARLPVRTHRVGIVDGMVVVTLSQAAPNLPPGRPAGTA